MSDDNDAQNEKEKLQGFAQLLYSALFFNIFTRDELCEVVKEERLIKWKKLSGARGSLARECWTSTSTSSFREAWISEIRFWGAGEERGKPLQGRGVRRDGGLRAGPTEERQRLCTA